MQRLETPTCFTSPVLKEVLFEAPSISVCAQSCLPLCNPMDCSPPCFPVHGISQARILDWVAISYSRGSRKFPTLPNPGIESTSLASPAFVRWVLYQLARTSLEKKMATQSSILAWEIPLTEESGGLQSMGLQRVGHD